MIEVSIQAMKSLLYGRFVSSSVPKSRVTRLNWRADDRRVGGVFHRKRRPKYTQRITEVVDK